MREAVDLGCRERLIGVVWGRSDIGTHQCKEVQFPKTAKFTNTGPHAKEQERDRNGGPQASSSWWEGQGEEREWERGSGEKRQRLSGGACAKVRSARRPWTGTTGSFCCARPRIHLPVRPFTWLARLRPASAPLSRSSQISCDAAGGVEGERTPCNWAALLRHVYLGDVAQQTQEPTRACFAFSSYIGTIIPTVLSTFPSPASIPSARAVPVCPVCRPGRPLAGWNASGCLGLAERISAAGEHLVKVILEPPDVWIQPSKLPHPVHLPVPVLVGAVCVALDCNLLAAGVCVSLMRHTELVPANDFLVRHLLPLGPTDEVLRLQQRISQHIRV